jgi:elongation factor 4
MFKYKKYLNPFIKVLKFNKRRFCDTISNSDDLSKIVKFIEKEKLESIKQENIRNFCIIAHIDHGKSTLSDRILEFCGAINKLEKKDSQVLDTLKVERERGITVKAQTATMIYKDQYIFNLIDTPGHVDFSYEVVRSLRPCQGAILLVDATKGVQAQTMSNFNQANKLGLHIMPVINKIDLPAAQIDSTILQITTSLGLDMDKILQISAKAGIGIDSLLENIITEIPAPSGDPDKPAKVLLFDARYLENRGVILLVEVIDGIIKKGDSLMSYHSEKKYDIFETGIVQPLMNPTGILKTGQVGYIITNMKNIQEAKIGDTFYGPKLDKKQVNALPGFEVSKCMVYAGIYPTDPSDYDELKRSLEKLQLSDASIKVEHEQSAALGSGFRIGFLGLLHLDVFNQRLEDEYDQNILITTPSVPYMCKLRGNPKKIYVENAMSAPAKDLIEYWEEQNVIANIITPKQFYTTITKLLIDKRGEELNYEEIDNEYIKITYELPLAEIVTDFFDKLKSLTQGYASLDYELSEFKKSDIKKISFLVNGEVIDALSFLVHESKSEIVARRYCKKLKDNLPPQLFQISIQAQSEKRIICREDVKALRKNVTAKCYGGDQSRKNKLLEKQKKGKKKMRAIGSVNVTSETFMALLKDSEE